jgi:UDP-N-acetylmuramoyl-tripeptide--D-alanyl-D-alanine ligase
MFSLAEVVQIVGGTFAAKISTGEHEHESVDSAAALEGASAREGAVVVDGAAVVDGSRSVAGFSTDSRTVLPGAAFIAVRGEKFDGHDFVGQALSAGACVAITEYAIADVPCIVVESAIHAYGQIAAEHLRRLRENGITVVALTGSSGKTSTKDLLFSVLSPHRRTLCPEGSFNNDIGLPATVLKADTTTEVLIVEMGMRGIGHIRRLCAIAPPDISVVLNVGSAHIGELGSQAAIAKAKQEIIESALPSAVSVLNADNPWVRPMAEVAHGPVIFFGESSDSHVHAGDVTMNDHGQPEFTLTLPRGESTHVTLPLIGRHQVANACAVAAVAYELGLDADEIARGLSSASTRSKWRMERVVRADGLTVINDAYNANPESVDAALVALAAYPCEGQRIAVLGAMRELGDIAESAHHAIGQRSAELGIDLVVAVGDCGPWIAEGREGMPTNVVTSVDEAITCLLALCAPRDVVLCKASRSVGMERVGTMLSDGFGTVSP